MQHVDREVWTLWLVVCLHSLDNCSCTQTNVAICGKLGALSYMEHTVSLLFEGWFYWGFLKCLLISSTFSSETIWRVPPASLSALPVAKTCHIKPWRFPYQTYCLCTLTSSFAGPQCTSSFQRNTQQTLLTTEE
jgi:hypothetical protein